jgi:Tol biopolymer transport system component
VRILDTGVLGDPSLTPDGKTVVYWRTKVPQDGGELVEAPVDGTRRRVAITKPTCATTTRTISPRRQTIAFTRGDPASGSPTSTAATPAGSAPARATRTRAWSPDGKRIAFKRNKLLWVMNADGSGARRVTKGLGRGHRGRLDGPLTPPC